MILNRGLIFNRIPFGYKISIWKYKFEREKINTIINSCKVLKKPLEGEIPQCWVF